MLSKRSVWCHYPLHSQNVTLWLLQVSQRLTLIVTVPLTVGWQRAVKWLAWLLSGWAVRRARFLVLSQKLSG
jgi:ABC-type arginine/histidine transport system permease subunit